VALPVEHSPHTSTQPTRHRGQRQKAESFQLLPPSTSVILVTPAPATTATACPTARRRIDGGTPHAAAATACPTARLPIGGGTPPAATATARPIARRRIGGGTTTACATSTIIARTTMCRRMAVAAARLTAVSVLLIPIPFEVHDLLPRRNPVAHHLFQTCVLALSNVLVVGAGIHVDAQLDREASPSSGEWGMVARSSSSCFVLKSLDQ